LGKERHIVRYLISLVIPVYNEETAILANLSTILESASSAWYDLELIVVDDGSRDASAREVANAASTDTRIRLISFTRNFGKEAAILAGLTNAKGDAVVVLDSDLQHPPHLIPRMVEFWRQGIYVVEAVKSDRGKESVSSALFAKGFYTLFKSFSGVDIEGHSDFKLLDRMAVDVYLSLPERHRFFRGLVGWVKYPSAQIPFSVPERANGTGSQWSKWKLLRYAIENLTSFSSLPLKLVSYVGLFTLLFGVIVGSISVLQKVGGHAIDGFTTVNLLIIIIGGALLLSVGILGHYMARLYDEIKARPSYLIKPPKREHFHERTRSRPDRRHLQRRSATYDEVR
jgi:glycosyltransferase involved in cell wall biosynthesis